MEEFKCHVCGGMTIRPKYAADGKTVFCPPCHVKAFISTYCCHTKGRWAGQSFNLLPWQNDMIDRAYGDLKPNGFRKHRIVYVEIPKKNGKSELASALALYGLKGEGEAGCEVYCLEEKTKILYSDLSWRPIGNVNIGDNIVGLDDEARDGETYRKMRLATVLNKWKREAETYRIRFDDGSYVECSENHKWLTRPPFGGGLWWRKTKDLYSNLRVEKVFTTWETDHSCEAGYLAGVFDGEGYFHNPSADRAGFRIGFSQNEGDVLRYVRKTLFDRSFSLTKLIDSKHGNVKHFTISGLNDSMRFLGSYRPHRLLKNSGQLWKNKSPICGNCYPRITSIMPVGKKRLIDIETDTGAFFAEGFVSHNSAAGDREQASLVYYPASYMVAVNPDLSSSLKDLGSKKRIVDHSNNGFYQVLSAEAFTKHGINPSMILFDELHAQPNRELWDVLTEGTDIAREQQLIFVLTTAGIADLTTIGYEIHNHALQCIRDPEFDTGFLPIVYAANVDSEKKIVLDKKDKDHPDGYDWEEEEVWKRCNPSLGHVFDVENLQTHYDNVKKNPARVNNFLRFRLNEWVSQTTRYIPMDMWGLCASDYDFFEEMAGGRVWGGLDLSSSIDLTALAFVGIKGDKFISFVHFYCPESTVEQRSKKDRVPYDRWVKDGYITATPGNSIDYAFIRRDIVDFRKEFEIVELAFDPYRADELRNTLVEKHKIEMVDHRQTYTDMSEPTKHIYECVVDKDLMHDNNPVLNWCIDNLAVKTDASENMRPVKDESADRIDGAVALIMALGRCLERDQFVSVYEDDDRGVICV